MLCHRYEFWHYSSRLYGHWVMLLVIQYTVTIFLIVEHWSRCWVGCIRILTCRCSELPLWLCVTCVVACLRQPSTRSFSSLFPRFVYVQYFQHMKHWLTGERCTWKTYLFKWWRSLEKCLHGNSVCVWWFRRWNPRCNRGWFCPKTSWSSPVSTSQSIYILSFVTCLDTERLTIFSFADTLPQKCLLLYFLPLRL